ncbi:hypothetical protein Pint_24265 [Pistacia integerrima]|uniref:Uncharacterized protein n=1 Tax=Pistacia integerrima TaxID=434235 RepID=A0ACC0YDM3_9ROSI|nr:hypothetical protein Pint_24265 [Pistacia integerrima]
MFGILNIFSLIYICYNSILYSSSFLFTKLPETYAFLTVMLVIPLFFFLSESLFSKLLYVSDEIFNTILEKLNHIHGDFVYSMKSTNKKGAVCIQINFIHHFHSTCRGFLRLSSHCSNMA